jgi:hypothetical protein
VHCIERGVRRHHGADAREHPGLKRITRVEEQEPRVRAPEFRGTGGLDQSSQPPICSQSEARVSSVVVASPYVVITTDTENDCARTRRRTPLHFPWSTCDAGLGAFTGGEVFERT